MTAALRAWYRGRRVFVTGHTGFKGAWLTAWLRDAGAEVTGYALAPAGAPNLYDAAGVGAGVRSVLGDVRDRDALARALRGAAPEVVLHLAAQAVVRRSYAEPVETFAANVLGTAHLLDAARQVDAVRAVVVVTSDKCYENRDLRRGYREDDPMGGHDPYSASKGCAELVTAAMRRSFFAGGAAAVASARAGNVVGGGDWAEDRLVPDLARAAAAGTCAHVRRPDAVRPWQFVLEPLRGYLLLGQCLAERGQAVAEAWNFGPRPADAVPVRAVVARMREAWPQVGATYATEAAGPHEAHHLELDCAKAAARLGWSPALALGEALALTADWYRAYYEEPARAAALVAAQLRAYERHVDALPTHPEP